GTVVRPDEAEDVVQAFLLHCLEKQVLERAVEGRGRFRGFVAMALRRFVNDYVNRRKRQRASPQEIDPETGKRRAIAPAGDEALQGTAGDDASDLEADILARDWSDCVLQRALDRVRRRSAANATWLALLLDGDDPSDDYVAGVCGVERSAVPLLRLRARRMMASELFREVADTTDGVEARRVELAELRPMLGDYLRRSQVGPLLEQFDASADGAA
ncbi:MAG: hypothetical protein KDB73_17285, partial [Planctomycetes bacterium]|nr:hypothetical protein [Planctomycetota bacterium]